MPAPEDPIKRQTWRYNLSKAHKGKIPWNKGKAMSLEFRLKIGELSKKFWADPSNIKTILIRNKKISESKRGDKNPMKRPEVKQKVSMAMRGKFMGDKNPSRKLEVRTKISQALIGHSFSLETRKKISKTLQGKMVGELNPFYGRHHKDEIKEKSRIRAINMISSGLLSKRRTDIELKVREVLIQDKLEFYEQVPLEGITVVDFYLPKYNIVIYCDGDYWHKGEWAEKYNIVKKDYWQTKVLEGRGYRVFRFSEADINSSPRNCINLVKNFIFNYGEEK